MSGHGEMWVQLQEARKQEMIREQKREECRMFQETIEGSLNEIDDAQILDLMKDASSSIHLKMQALDGQVQDTPDTVLKGLKSLQQDVQKALNDARIKAEGISREQAELQSLVNTIKREGEMLKQMIKPDAGKTKTITKLVSDVHDCSTFNDAKGKAQKARGEFSKFKEMYLKELERKKIVSLLIASLKQAGFVSSKPVLNESNVILKGKLPSGKIIEFSINSDAKINFNLDGYEGETCQDQLKDLMEKLGDSGVKSEIKQFSWHNPDRLKKGAKELPIGGQVMKTGGHT